MVGGIDNLKPNDPPLWEMMKEYARYKFKRKKPAVKYTWLEDDLTAVPAEQGIDADFDRNDLDDILGIKEKSPNYTRIFTKPIEVKKKTLDDILGL